MSEQTLKSKLKPLIKECLLEIMVENGILSGLISEVLKGVKTSGFLTEIQVAPRETRQITESKQPQSFEEKRKIIAEKKEQERQEKIRRLNETLATSMGMKGKKLDIFEGLEPIRESVRDLQEVRTPAAVKSASSAAANPLRDTNPNDPGIPDDLIEKLLTR